MSPISSPTLKNEKAIQKMQNKRLNNRVGGVSANALTMPIVVILSILHVLIIAVIAVLPIMAIYPFFQKSFVRGIVIGGVKG